MHLVILAAELATAGNSCGGSASFTANLARIFRRNGHRVTIVVITTKKEEIVFDTDIAVRSAYVEKALWDDYNRIAAVTAAVTGEAQDEIRKYMVNIHKSELAKKMIREIDREDKIDMIHASNLCGLSLGLEDDIPYVVRISSYYNMWDNAELPEGTVDYGKCPMTIKDRLEVYMLQKAKYIISPSHLLAGIGRLQLGIEATVMESPFLLDREHWDYSVYDSLVKGKKYLLHYGRMAYAKGTHIVAQTVKHILKKYSDRLVVLAGRDSEMRSAEGGSIKGHELVEKSAQEYADRVIYTGCLAREQLYPLIQHAEVCLLPSRLENLSNACIEAMAMGKIVIGTNGASFEQLIDDRISGYLCERDDPDSFMRAVEEALTMGETARRRMGSRAVERTRRLAPEVIYEEYHTFYRKVIREWRQKNTLKNGEEPEWS